VLRPIRFHLTEQTEMNALLQQQLLKYFGSVSTDDRQLQAFIAAVGEAYDRWQASKPYPIEPAQGDLPDFQAESGSEPATMNSDFSPFSVRRQRVLVADDNDVNRRMASLMLERLNCSADFARDGLEAVEAWERSRHDAILMDCQMPKMGGFEATLEIRRREAARDTSPADRVRIVALTANAFKGQREQCLAAQMDDYLSKPFDLAQLRATLMRNLKDWGSNADRRLAPDSGAAVFHPEKLSRLCTDLGKENVVAIVRSFTVELPGTVARLHEWRIRCRASWRPWGWRCCPKCSPNSRVRPKKTAGLDSSPASGPR
jgi:CheY-like chemotaxis protein